jgi:hypothetical protein
VIIKILKNRSAEELTIINLVIPPDGEVLVEPTLWAKLMQQNDYIINLINAGSLVVNDGTSDLSASEAIDYLYLFQEKTSAISRNFSYNNVKINESITIPDGQQMRVYQELRVSGDLNIYGEAIVKDV